MLINWLRRSKKGRSKGARERGRGRREGGGREGAREGGRERQSFSCTVRFFDQVIDNSVHALIKL